MIRENDNLQYKEFDIQQFIYFLKRNYIKIILGTLFSTLIGCFLILSTNPIYASNGKILIEKKDDSAFGIESLEGFSDKSTIEDKIEILESRTIAESTVKKIIHDYLVDKSKKLFLLETKEYEPRGFRKTFKGILTLGGLINRYPDVVEGDFNEARIRRIIKKLQESTSINNIQGTNILSIEVESLNPEESRKLVKAFIDSYIEKEKEWSNAVTESKIDFLEKQILKKTNELNKIEDNIQAYQENQDIYNLDGDASLLVSNFVDLENKHNQEKILYKDLEYRKTLFENELNKVDISKTRELAVKDSIRSLNISIKISDSRIENINSQLLDNQNSLDELPEKTKNFVRLKRDALILENTLILLEENLQSAKIAYESASGQAQIIVEPALEYEKVKPKVFINVILSILAGIFLSSILLYLAESLSTAIKSVEELELFGLSVLSIIPSIGSDKKRNKKTKNNSMDLSRRLIMTEDPKSPISEAYRTLRTSIMYSSDKDSKIIMISSPGPGEGKTTTVCNLAITYANLGKKTLLIDGDLRKPVINKIFNLNKNLGLTSYIIGENSIEDIVQKTEIDNFDVIPSGIVPPNPSEILNSDKMKNMLETLKEKYDIILIDSPPMIAVTDALVLSNLVDDFILVCRSKVTQKGALDRSIKSLNQIGGKFNGCILNAIDSSTTYGSGYYYNYYQYYYGEK
tara:strand:- start:10687 stop:12756 length:2070 start_codon:yes stop_codon:yes gene_type:complete